MQKENSKKIVWGIVGVVVLVATFYGGMVYGGNNVRAAISSRGTFGQNGAGGMMRGNRTGGFTAGQIIAKDTNSITVQIMNSGPGATSQQGGSASTNSGGSKIIFLDNNTKITKSVDGTASDLAVGTQVSVTGTANTDGSVSAQSVQIRPNTPQGAKVQ